MPLWRCHFASLNKYKLNTLLYYTVIDTVLPKILAISQHAVQSWCWKSRQGQHALEWEAVARPQQGIRAKKITSTCKLEIGLNFSWMLTFGFARMILIKKLKAKMWFLLFFYDVKNGHFCSCPNSNTNILQKSLIFLHLLGI